MTCPHAASLVDSWQGGCMGKGSLSSRFQHAGWGAVGNGDSDRLPFPVLASSDPMDRQEGASCRPVMREADSTYLPVLVIEHPEPT